MEQTLNLVSGSINSTSTVSYHLSIACANGNHQDDRVIKDKPEGRY
jgi:DNA-binding transcriptional regulator WhiA